MASAGAIATMNQAARRDLKRAMTVIAEVLGVPPKAFSYIRADPAYQSASELKTLAAWSQEVALEVLGRLGGDRSAYQQELARQAFDWNSLPDEALREIATRRKVRNADNLLRDDLLRAVQQLSWEDGAEVMPDAAAPDYDAMTRAEAIKRAQAAELPSAEVEVTYDFDAMSRDDVLTEAKRRGMDVKANTTKTAGVEFIQANLEAEREVLDGDIGAKG